jgi:hypothetical protein
MNAQQVLSRFDDQITHRQLDSWARQGYLGNSQGFLTGTGIRRDYPAPALAVLDKMVPLVLAGVAPAVASKIARGDSVAFTKLNVALKGARSL